MPIACLERAIGLRSYFEDLISLVKGLTDLGAGQCSDPSFYDGLTIWRADNCGMRTLCREGTVAG